MISELLRPPVTDDYVEEPAYTREYYSPPNQDYSAKQDYDYPQERYSPPKQEYREPEYQQPEYRQSEYRQQEYRESAYQQQQQPYNTNISPQKPVVQKQQQQQQQQFISSNP